MLILRLVDMLGEFVTLRTEALFEVPEDMDAAEVAPLACAGVSTFNPMRNMNLVAGDVVAVQGIGGECYSRLNYLTYSRAALNLLRLFTDAGLGHLGIQFARQSGYKTVAISRGGGKKALAEELGAHIYIDADTGDAAQQLLELGGAKVILGQSILRPFIVMTVY